MKLLKTTKCTCGIQLETKNLAPGWLPIQVDKGFLGGKRVRFKEAVCLCGKEYAALMVTDGNNFKFLDLVEVEENAEEVPFEPEKPKTKAEERKELIARAKELGVEGKIATMGSDKLKELIQAKLSQ